MPNLFAPDDIVQHIASKHIYRVLGRCTYEPDLTECYHYRGPNGQVWVRPAAEMEDGRFKLISFNEHNLESTDAK